MPILTSLRRDDEQSPYYVLGDLFQDNTASVTDERKEYEELVE